MKMKEAVKRVQALNLRMNTAADEAQAAGIRYDAHMNLFNAACKMGDKEEAEKQRVAIHAQIDAILDAGHVVHESQLEINVIIRSPAD